ncbi:MAG: MqnA/MqnD/SBP family protein [Sulfurimonadaceae bacterium]
MLFGKIEYLNLLPFHLFMKRYSRSTRHYMSFRYKKGVPSKINTEYAARRVDAAFISSIKAQKERYVDLGIIAKKEVLSVLLLPSETDQEDRESASSNVLAKVLALKGEVLIGDKALRHYLQGDENAIDLAKAWHDKYKLPFVFALLCYHRHDTEIKKLARTFKKERRKIPQYQLINASKRTGISTKAIQHYLTYISYELDNRAKAGLRKFWHLSKEHH